MSRARTSARGRQATLAGTVAAVAIALALQWLGGGASETAARGSGSSEPAAVEAPRAAAAPRERARDADEGAAEVEAAFRARRSGFMVTVEGRVARTLPDDDEGSRHQRFLVELPTGRTLLVAHNIDLAPRVPLSRGDAVRVRGQYEWNDRGGVLHWTHHDPQGRHDEGFVELGAQRYR